MLVRVAFVDDHPILLEGLVSLYSTKPDLAVVAMGHTTVDALNILENHRPDVIVMDLSMPGDSFAAIELMLASYPQTKVIVFTASSAIQPAVELIEAGISGYVLKGSSSSDLHEAIIRAHNGETYITPGFATKVIVSMKTAEIRRRAPQPNAFIIVKNRSSAACSRGRRTVKSGSASTSAKRRSSTT